MSTHAYIGRPTAVGGEGRYLHSDGYPTHALRVLADLVRKHGADTVTAVIVDTGDWSTLEGAKSRFYPWHSDDNNILVQGYGVAYRPPEDENNEPMPGDMADTYTWAYVLHPDRVAILHDGRAVDMVKWAELTSAKIEQIEREGEALCQLVI